MRLMTTEVFPDSGPDRAHTATMEKELNEMMANLLLEKKKVNEKIADVERQLMRFKPVKERKPGTGCPINFGDRTDAQHDTKMRHLGCAASGKEAFPDGGCDDIAMYALTEPEFEPEVGKTGRGRPHKSFKTKIVDAYNRGRDTDFENFEKVLAALRVEHCQPESKAVADAREAGAKAE